MKIINNLKLVLIATILAACNGLPSAYQGNYKDKANGVNLTLNSGSAEISFKNGRKIKSDAEEMSFEALYEGKTGIFSTSRGRDKGLVHIYYVRPIRGTAHTESNFMWYNAEIIYTQADPNRERAVSSIQVIHCTEGNVMLDLPSKRVMLGCGAGAAVYNMKKTNN